MELIVYRQEYGDRGLWVRPAAMFGEAVVVDGKTAPRFAATARAAANAAGPDEHRAEDADAATRYD